MTKAENTHELPGNVMIDGQALTRIQTLAVARHYATVNLGIESIARIQAARTVIDTLAAQDEKVYGVTTGLDI